VSSQYIRLYDKPLYLNGPCIVYIMSKLYSVFYTTNNSIMAACIFMLKKNKYMTKNKGGLKTEWKGNIDKQEKNEENNNNNGL